MADPSKRTFVCCVLFLDIVEYSTKSVSEQLKLKQRFNTMLVSALHHIALGDRIVLDTGDGAAISFLGNPEDSLFVAMDLRDAIAAESASVDTPLLVRIGINLGPVRLIKDINDQLNIIGDGINVAQRVMSFCEPGMILVSRSYYEVVSRLSDDYQRIFEDVGTRTDKHVREHAVFAVGIASTAAHWRSVQGIADIERQGATKDEGRSETPRSKIRLPYLLGVPVLGLMIIGAAVGLRHSNAPSFPSTTVGSGNSLPAKASPQTPGASQSPHAGRDAADAGTRTNVMRTEVAGPVVLKGTLELSILPWGEVFIDGRKRGVSPPLKSLSLPAGRHRVEIRNSAFPVHTEIIEIERAGRHRVRFRFQ